jgi:penicillin-binding protein 1A
VLTPGSLLLDVTTEFARGWFPRNADIRERGPVLVRDALTYSLNIPVIRALDRVGVDTVASLAAEMGLTFARGDRHLAQAGLAGAIGTAETNMVELTSAFGALANSGSQMAPRPILQVFDSSGAELPIVPANEPKQVVSPQAAWLVTDILKDSTDPEVNNIFGPRLRVDGPPTELAPDGERRYAAAKTGTTNDLRDLSVYGYLGPPADPAAPHVVASVWLGNSDHSPPNGGDIEIIAADGPGRIWSAFLRELSEPWPNAPFPSPPQGVVAATIDMWSGGAPGPWTRDTRVEYFIEGTQPGGNREVDERGLLYRQMCNRWWVDIVKVEQGRVPDRWLVADMDWMDRARRGTGRRGENNSITAHLFGRRDWGGFIAPVDCASAPTLPPPTAPPAPSPTPTGLPATPLPEQPLPEEPTPTPAPGG